MIRRMLITFTIVSLAVLLASLFAACGGPAPSQEEPTAQPASIEGESLLQERCTVCHGLSRVTQAQKTPEKWEQTVARMVGKGAQLNAGEQATLIEYLAETYGP